MRVEVCPIVDEQERIEVEISKKRELMIGCGAQTFDSRILELLKSPQNRDTTHPGGHFFNQLENLDASHSETPRSREALEEGWRRRPRWRSPGDREPTPWALGRRSRRAWIATPRGRFVKTRTAQTSDLVEDVDDRRPQSRGGRIRADPGRAPGLRQGADDRCRTSGTSSRTRSSSRAITDAIPKGADRVIDKKVRQVVVPANRLEDAMRALSGRELAAKTDEFRDRLKKGETLDDLLVEAFAVVRECARRELNMRTLRRPARRRRAAARRVHLRDGHGRGQDADGDAARVP